MTIPNLLITFLISILIGVIFHIIRGGNGWRLLIYIAISCVGFFLANWIGESLGWDLYSLGVLDAGLGVVGSVLSLVIGEWLMQIKPNKKSGL